eukprot:23030-Prymnesium_polylepis.1
MRGVATFARARACVFARTFRFPRSHAHMDVCAHGCPGVGGCRATGRCVTATSASASRWTA